MEYVLSDRKLLPYGMMNFEDIRLDNYYYVDKTAFIPLIEQSDRFFFFIRPRRFGKSLNIIMTYVPKISLTLYLATFISESTLRKTVIAI
jgi:hypothetical protein